MGLLQYGSMDRRFFHRLGASLLDRTICASAGKAGWAAVIGASMGMDVEHYEDSKLILIWGSNPITSNLHFWTRAQEAKRRGAKLVAIDPYRSATAEKCHEHIALMPGTDAALAYGIMHVLIRDGLVDRDYVERYTVGFDALAARAQEWTPERVAATCGIAGRAGRVARARLRHDQAGGDPPQLRHAARRRRRQRRARGRLPAGADRRVARLRRRRAALVVRHLSGRRERARASRPHRRHAAHDQHVGDRRCADVAHEPPVKAIYVYNSNPVAVAPESAKVVQGFAREDLFVVVHELFQTDTADYADILLPATSQLEHLDVHTRTVTCTCR